MNNQESNRFFGMVNTYILSTAKSTLLLLFLYAPFFSTYILADTNPSTLKTPLVSIEARFSCFEAGDCESSDPILFARVQSCQSEEKLEWNYIVYNDETNEVVQYSYNHLPIPSSGVQGDSNFDLLLGTMQAKFAIVDVLPVGLYRVEWTLIDDIIHIFHKSQFFTIVDNVAPEPILYSFLSINNPYFLKAKEFDKGDCGDDCIDSYDNCSNDIYFTFTPKLPNFDEDYSKWAKQYTKYGMYFFNPETGLISTEPKFYDGYADAWLPSEKTSVRSNFCWQSISSSNTKNFKIYVWDQFAMNDDCDYNNYSYEEVSAYFPTFECGSPIQISGKITNLNNKKVEGMNVFLSANEQQDTKTNNKGEYLFFLPNEENSEYKIEAYSDNDYTNGVTTLDIVMIQKHLLGIKKIKNPYKLIAADVNKNYKISASDILEMRSAILGRTDSFTNNSWVCIPKDYNFNKPLQAYSELDKAKYFKGFADTGDKNIDFWAIKIGDISLNASLPVSRSTKHFTIEDRELEYGKTYKIPVYADDFEDLLGLQFSLNFKDLELLDIIPGSVRIESSNMNIIDNNLLVSWNNSSALNLEGNKELFTLVFKSKYNNKLSSLLSFKNERINSEIYTKEDEVYNLFIEFRDNQVNNLLLQNIPNPFSDRTVIKFNLKEKSNYIMVFFDLSGQTLATYEGKGLQGENSFTIDRVFLKRRIFKEQNYTKVIFYKLITNEYYATKKMILINH